MRGQGWPSQLLRGPHLQVLQGFLQEVCSYERPGLRSYLGEDLIVFICKLVDDIRAGHGHHGGAQYREVALELRASADFKANDIVDITDQQ